MALEPDGNWDALLAAAQAEVEAVVSELPPELLTAAQGVPVRFESAAGPERVAEGLDADLLGLFVGDPVGTPLGEQGALPAEILLFLESLWEFVEGDEEAFLEEVRITYLHELGHALGLNEEELEDRGLL